MYKLKRENCMFKLLVWSKQNNAAYMKDIVQKFVKPRTLFVENSAERCSVSKACAPLSNHRRFVGCKVDSSWKNKVVMLLILLFARQALIEESDINGKRLARSSTEVYDKAVEPIEKRRLSDVREVPGGLLPMQTFPPHILCHLNMCFAEQDLGEITRNILANRWTGKNQRDWICAALDQCLLFAVELLVYLWKSRQYYMKVLDKKLFWLSNWSRIGVRRLLRVTRVLWPQWVKTAQDYVWIWYDGDDYGAVFRVVFQDSGHNCGWRGCWANSKDISSSVELHAVHQWCHVSRKRQTCRVGKETTSRTE